MSAITQFLRLADEYARVAGVPETTVSSRVFDDGKKIAMLRAGADVQVLRLERAIAEISARWPEGVDWPEGIERPIRNEAAA